MRNLFVISVAIIAGLIAVSPAFAATSDSVAILVSICNDADGDGYGVGFSCAGPDCDDEYDTCTTDCVTDIDSDGIPDCRDYCPDITGVGDSDIRLDTAPPGTANSRDPQISSDFNGHVYVTWEDFRNGYWDVYLNIFTLGGPFPEICDDLDNDCDGVIDDGCDDDGDDYCDAGMTVIGNPAVCPNGGSDCDDDYASCTTDCATDADADTVPDCRDDCLDADGDGYGVDGTIGVCLGADCNDGNSDVNPEVIEICDGSDNDCDDLVDCDDPDLPCSDYYRDDDSDNYGVDGDTQTLCAPFAPYDATQGGDCDDGDAAINPSAAEIACNGIDDDCSPATPDDPNIDLDPVSLCAGDCDDNDPNNYPGNNETCDGQDNDCDDLGDCDDPDLPCSDYYRDDDSDSYGVDGDTQTLCATSPPYSALQGGDCDDADEFINPGEAETTCNVKDDDCNPATLDDYNIDGDPVSLCAGDCDDNDPNNYPGGTELCYDQSDNDCDSYVDGNDPDCQPCVIYVDDDGVCPGEGSSADPLCDIQTALDIAKDDCTIIVGDGLYTGADNKNLDFGGKAITLQSENGPAGAVIDCEGSGRGFYFHSGETSSSVVDGFTITNGGGVGRGGGIYSVSSSPTIRNCIIIGNSATTGGGGIDCESGASTIIDCTISGNSADYGGGINLRLDWYSPTITGCAIVDNTANLGGGGIACSYSSPTLTNCTISGNISSGYGGGISCFPSSATIANCTLSGNSAATHGGGIYCEDSSSPTIINSIMWNNSAGTDGQEIALATSSTLTVSYSDVEGGEAAAYVNPGCTLYLDEEPDNIDSDPLFAGVSDSHLTGPSPCIDTGIDASVDADIDGGPRPVDIPGVGADATGTEYDMGSDEFDGAIWFSGHPWEYDYTLELSGDVTICDQVPGRDGCRSLGDFDEVRFIEGILYTNFMKGTEGIDNLSGTPANDMIFGFGGADYLRGHNGDDLIIGGPDDDRLYGDNNNDILLGEGGSDRIYTGNGDDTAYGGDGDGDFTVLHDADDANDFVDGGDGVDDKLLLANGYGSFTMVNRHGLEEFEGGDGDDYVDWSGASVGVKIRGNNGNDTLIGGSGNDILQSGAGNDTCLGNGGCDLVILADADYVLDTFDGGADSCDRLLLDNGYGCFRMDDPQGFENFTGGDGDDEIDWSAATVRVVMRGNGGDDILTAGSGNDLLTGGDGDDVLTGGGGPDILYGEGGVNHLTGGCGDDGIRGGGSDYAHYSFTPTLPCYIVDDRGSYIVVRDTCGCEGVDIVRDCPFGRIEGPYSFTPLCP